MSSGTTGVRPLVRVRGGSSAALELPVAANESTAGGGGGSRTKARNHGIEDEDERNDCEEGPPITVRGCGVSSGIKECIKLQVLLQQEL